MESKLSTNLKVLVVEDTQSGLKLILEYAGEAGLAVKNIQVAANQLEAMKVMKSEDIGLAILDLKIPDQPGAKKAEVIEHGLVLLRWITANYGETTRVIVVSQYPHNWVVFQVLALGVSMVDKETSFQELPWVIERTLQGHIVYTSRLDSTIRSAFKDAMRVELEPEEVDILRMIHKSQLSNVSIGQKMDYSLDTIKGKLRELYNLTGIHDRHQIAAWYFHYIAPFYGYELDSESRRR